MRTVGRMRSSTSCRPPRRTPTLVRATPGLSGLYNHGHQEVFRLGRCSSSAAVMMEDPALVGSSWPVQPRGPTTQPKQPIYVAATRQHVGKTSVSLALMSGLQKRFERVGFIKPVGQQSLTVQDGPTTCLVDKDAALVKQHFHLDHLPYQCTSPVLIPPGYTRDYLDGVITTQEQRARIEAAYQQVSASSDVVLCEGTGHCAVGSIIHASNAAVASWLGARMVLVANGGLGHSFDELDLNRTLCEKHGVEIAGVVINKVKPDKYDQTRHYLSKAFAKHWGPEIPLLGCIPDRPFLGCPALADMERILKATLVSGQEHRLRHYRTQDLHLVATSLEVFLRHLRKAQGRTLYICHASRNDILLGFLMESVNRSKGYYRRKEDPAATTSLDDPRLEPAEAPWESALVVTGCDDHPMSTQVLEIVTSMTGAPPILLTPAPTDQVMEKMYAYTPKLNYEDGHRVEKTVAHYEPYIDFDLLLSRVGYDTSSMSTLSSSSSSPYSAVEMAE